MSSALDRSDAPVLDLCVPFWGDPADLRATVLSVLAQDDPHWRLTILDDCYPEDVSEWIGSHGDDRITYRRNEQNVGIVENFRRAIAAARGPRVVVLGSDDVLHPHYVRTVRRAVAGAPEVDVLQVGVDVIDGDGHPVLPLADRVKLRLLTPNRRTVLQGQDLARSLLTGNWLYWPSLVFRTETARRYDFRDDLPIILDLALLLDIAFDEGTLLFVPEVCFSYRRHAASLSQKSIVDGSRFRDERRYYREVAARAGARGWTRARRAARWRLMSRLHGLSALPGVVRHGRPAITSVLALTFAP